MTETKTTRAYRNPPIEEALVEFRFASGKEWDPTIPGKLHQVPTIAAQYPGKARTQKAMEAVIQGGPDQVPNFSVREGFSRIQLWNEGGTRLLWLAPDVLGVGGLRPYEGWAALYPRIEIALNAYATLAGHSAVTRIGVRYINKVVVPEPQVSADRFFLCGPTQIKGVRAPLTGFITRAESRGNDGELVAMTHATIEAPDGHTGFLFDLDVIWESDSPLPITRAMAKVDELHQREGVIFEANITDAARKVFDE